MNIKAEAARQDVWIDRRFSYPGELSPHPETVPSLPLALAVTLISLTVLIFGWGLGVDALIRIRPDYPAMVPETALSLLAGSIGVAAMTVRAPVWIARLAVLFIALDIAGYFWRPLLVTGLGNADGMSIATAVGLGCIAVSLGLRTLPAFRRSIVPQVFDSIGAFASTTALIGYLFNADALTGVKGFSLIALHTALGLLLLQLALLCLDRHRGWVSLIFDAGQGGRIFRRVVPNLIFLTLVVCLVALRATEAGWLTANFRLALVAAALVFMLAVAGLIIVRQTARAEHLSAQLAAARLATQDSRHSGELRSMRAANMKSLNQLVTGVTRDFNATLEVANRNIDLLKTDTALRDRYFQDVLDAAARAAALTVKLLSHARRATMTPEFRELEPLVRRVVETCRRVTPDAVEIDLDLQLGAGDGAVVDAAALESALHGLIASASDAMPSGGRVEIRARVETFSESRGKYFNPPRGLAPGEYLVVSVCDTTGGMSPESLLREVGTFEETGELSGSGLLAAAECCSAGGGGICIDSRPGHRTTVFLAFPRAERPAASAPAAADISGSGEPAAVLLVVENATLSNVLRQQFERDGHPVAVARTADEALAAIDRGPVPSVCVIDLGPSDRAAGGELAMDLKRRHRDMAVVQIPTGPADLFALVSGGDRLTSEPVRSLLRSPRPNPA